MAEPSYGPAGTPIEVVPVVVLSQVFPARQSSIPDIRDFVKYCLTQSPLTAEATKVGETVFRALLDAAGPTGSIQVAFRIFPEHVEVDVLHSGTATQPPAAPGPPVSYPVAGVAGPSAAGVPAVRLGTTGRAPGHVHAVPEPPRGPGLGGAGRPAGAGPRPAPPTPAGAAAPSPGAGDNRASAASATPETFAEWMSNALRRERLTQEAAARQLGVSAKTVSRWVGGATEPRMRDLRRIQQVFGALPLP